MVEYILVSCHAFKTHLLPKSMIYSLCTAEDVRSIVDALLQTDYGADLSRQTKVDAHTLERIFSTKLVERYSHLIKLIERYTGLVKLVERHASLLKLVERHASLLRLVEQYKDFAPYSIGFMESSLWRIYEESLGQIEPPPKGICSIIKAYTRKLELQNVIRILRGKFTKTPNELIEEYLIPLKELSNIRFNDLLKADSIDVAVRMLGNTIYSQITEALKLSHEFKSFLPIEMKLWTLYYNYLLGALSNVPKSEREDLKRIIGTEIDAINTLICTASIVYGYGKEFVRSLIIPFSFKVTIDTFKIAMQAESIETLKRLLSPYAKIIDHIVNGDDISAQVESYRYIRKEAEKQLLKDSTYAYVLSYMLLCEIEYKDLTLIALGKQYGLKPEELRPRLISSD
ncbi:MAG: V-type ATPase subunit [Nitrososphaerales archaeon]